MITGVCLCTMKFITIDVQGFFNNPNFVPKELALTDGKKSEHFLIKPSRPFHYLSYSEIKEVQYLEKHHHGISYSDGHIEINELIERLKEILSDGGVDVVYVKGHQKAIFLHELLKEYIDGSIKIKNLEHLSTETSSSSPNLVKQRPQCFSHKLQNCVCALTNCWILYNYLVGLLP